MRRPHIGQVETVVQLLLRNCKLRRVDHHITVARLLDQNPVRFKHVAQAFDLDEIFAEQHPVTATILIGVQLQPLPLIQPLHIIPVGNKGYLPQFAEQFGIEPVAQCAGNLLHRPLSHSVYQQIGSAFEQYRRLEAVAPVVVMGQTAQRRLDTTYHNRYVRVEPFQDLRVDRNRIVGPEPGLAASRIGIVAAQTQVGRIVVNHRVHRARRNPEKEPRGPQLPEIAQVIAPVRLRNDRYTIPFGLEQPPHNRRSE